MKLIKPNYINGSFHESSADVFESRNPADIEEVLGKFPKSGEEEVNLAVESAKTAFDSWDSVSRIKRGELLDNLAQLTKRDLDDLAVLVSKECGKHINEGRADVVEALHMIQYAAALARMPHGEILESEIAEKDTYMLRRPAGIIAVITPWNFPIAIPTWLIGIPLPFGGLKKSGNGHPSAAALIETVTHRTAWTENYGKEIKMAQGLSAKV